MSLVARRTRIDADLAARARWAAAREGVLHADFRRTLSGFGTLHQVELGPLAELPPGAALLPELTAIELTGADGPMGSMPRCHVAFPFDPEVAGVAMIPALQVTESDGGTWLCVIAEDAVSLDVLEWDARELLKTIEPPAIDTPVEVRHLVETPSPHGYADAVAAAIEQIRTGALTKVVLARSVDLEAAHDLDAAAVLQRMAEREPACTRYAFPAPGGGRLVGASPELLISRSGLRIESHPLAGTLTLSSADADPAELLRSAKDLDEHRHVVDDLAESLRPLLATLNVPDGPSIVTLRSVAHLGTLLVGSVSGGTDDPHLLELLKALHPTPAVGGVPRTEAIHAIATLEGPRRNYFAGGIGWCNAVGEGEWVLGIRGATLRGTRCELTAGAGIVTDSTPVGEAEETRSKLASVLEAIAPGSGALLAQVR